jgi:hypothetical protein
MLATQLQPSSYFTKSGHSHSDRDSATQYRPVKDAEAFKALLPAIEFVEGSSTGAFAVPEAKYQPINVGPTVRQVTRFLLPVGSDVFLIRNGLGLGQGAQNQPLKLRVSLPARHL